MLWGILLIAVMSRCGWYRAMAAGASGVTCDGYIVWLLTCVIGPRVCFMSVFCRSSETNMVRTLVGGVAQWLAAWRRMNEVNARRARLVPGWVTVFGRVCHLGMYQAN